MMKKTLLVVVPVLVILGAIGWANRVDLLLSFVQFRAAGVSVEPHREVVWQQGPDEAEVPVEQRPPNIIFILADLNRDFVNLLSCKNASMK